MRPAFHYFFMLHLLDNMHFDKGAQVLLQFIMRQLKLTWRAERKTPFAETGRIARNSRGARFLHCICKCLFRSKCDERNYSLSFRA